MKELPSGWIEKIIDGKSQYFYYICSAIYLNVWENFFKKNENYVKNGYAEYCYCGWVCDMLAEDNAEIIPIEQFELDPSNNNMLLEAQYKSKKWFENIANKLDIKEKI